MRRRELNRRWRGLRFYLDRETREPHIHRHAVSEDEAAYEATTHTAVDVPVELLPIVRMLLAKRKPT